MSERQKFGFDFQKTFCEKNNLLEDNKYTGKFDAKGNDINYQIKTYKNNGELMMADPFRYLDNKEDFVLVVANRNNKNEIINERKVLIKNNEFQSFLQKQHFKERAEYCQNVLNSVSNNRSDDSKFTSLMEKEKKARKDSILNMQAKRNHKTQKRVQWSIPNRFIEDFLNLFENYEERN